MSKGFPAVNSKEVVKVLESTGFKLKMQAGGSHAIYYRETDKKRTTVPIHPRQIIKRRTLKSILSDAGLTMEEFEELRK